MFIATHTANQTWTPPTGSDARPSQSTGQSVPPWIQPAGQDGGTPRDTLAPSQPQDAVDLSGLKGLKKFVHDAGRQLAKVHPVVAGIVGTVVGAVAAGPIAGIVLGATAAWGANQARKAEAALAGGKAGVREAQSQGQPTNPARGASLPLAAALGAATSAAGAPILLGLGVVIAGSYALTRAADAVGREITRQAHS